MAEAWAGKRDGQRVVLTAAQLVVKRAAKMVDGWAVELAVPMAETTVGKTVVTTAVQMAALLVVKRAVARADS